MSEHEERTKCGSDRLIEMHMPNPLLCKFSGRDHKGTSPCQNPDAEQDLTVIGGTVPETAAWVEAPLDLWKPAAEVISTAPCPPD